MKIKEKLQRELNEIVDASIDKIKMKVEKDFKKSNPDDNRRFIRFECRIIRGGLFKSKYSNYCDYFIRCKDFPYLKDIKLELSGSKCGIVLDYDENNGNENLYTVISNVSVLGYKKEMHRLYKLLKKTNQIYLVRQDGTMDLVFERSRNGFLESLF